MKFIPLEQTDENLEKSVLENEYSAGREITPCDLELSISSLRADGRSTIFLMKRLRVASAVSRSWIRGWAAA